MIQHYLKIVFRNILKHKTQSIISIVGLAIGLACFALSTFWIQYEMTYDSFHRDADRIYLIRTDENHFGTHYHNFVPYALGGYLKNSYSKSLRSQNRSNTALIRSSSSRPSNSISSRSRFSEVIRRICG